MDQSPLNKLPAEIREYIYHFVLVGDEPVVLDISEDEGKVRMAKDPEQKHVLGITKTCKQIRTESLPVFFKGNHFKTTTFVDLGPSHDSVLSEILAVCAWKTDIDSWIFCLRSLEIVFDARARDLGLVERDFVFWATAFKTLRDTFDLPKLQLGISILASSSANGVEGYNMVFRIVGDGTDQSLAQLDEDVKHVVARIKSESPDEYGDIAIREFERMKKGLEHIVCEYKGEKRASACHQAEHSDSCKNSLDEKPGSRHGLAALEESYYRRKWSDIAGRGRHH